MQMNGLLYCGRAVRCLVLCLVPQTFVCEFESVTICLKSEKVQYSVRLTMSGWVLPSKREGGDCGSR